MATITVSNTNSSGAGSLAAAVEQANYTPEDDNIVFAGNLSGQTIVLSEALLISQGTTRISGDIDGDGVTDITISGDTNGNGVADNGDAKILRTLNDGQAELRNLIMTNGYDGPSGPIGVISNDGSGTLSIIDSVIKNSVSVGATYNYAVGFTNAATVSNFVGNLTIFGTLFEGNISRSGEGVGSDGPNNVSGILNTNGVLSIDRVGFTGAAYGGGAPSGFQGGDAVLGIIATRGAIQGNGEDPRLGVSPTATLVPGISVSGDPGDAVAGLLEARDGLEYTINTPMFGLSGGSGNDGLGDSNSFENQIILGFGGADALVGGRGEADVIFGGDGDDVLAVFEGAYVSEAAFASGTRPSDKVFGGTGDDTISLTSNDNATRSHLIDGGTGQDIITFTDGDFPNGVSVDLRQTELQRFSSNTTVQMTSVENVSGTGFADNLIGDEAANQLFGLGGSDTLTGGGGVNLLDGGSGQDIAVFSGALSTASVNRDGNALRIELDSETTSVTGVEFFDFTDGFFTLTQVEALVEDEPQATSYALQPSTITVDEDDGAIAFFVRRSGELPAETVFFSTTITSGSSNDGDYVGQANRSVSFSAGQTQQSISFQIIDDAVVETTETFGAVVQRSASDPVSVFLARAAFTITDDDAATTVNEATQDDDLLTGTALADNISALGGNDVVIGLGGDDILLGGAGDDSIRGGGGNDIIRGSGGLDNIKGNGGADNLNGNGGGDIIRGGGGADVIKGGGGSDTVKAGGGSDTLNGGGGSDRLEGGGGDDVISGRGGDDTLVGNAGADTFQFRASDRNDTILDFRQGQDKIQILSGASTFDDLRFEQVGNDVLISFGAGGVRVVSDAVRAFDASDFLGLRDGGGGSGGGSGGSERFTDRLDDAAIFGGPANDFDF